MEVLFFFKYFLMLKCTAFSIQHLFSMFSCFLLFAEDNVFSDVVDIFNANTNSWSTAALSLPRADLAATSLPNLGIAIFAGGQSTLCVVYL
jgi:hypothetical protein